MKAKVGDSLNFKKFRWTITEVCRSYPYGVEFYKYRVHRKYFEFADKYWVPLSNTKCTYTVLPWRWHFLERQLKKDSNYHYNMSLWSNAPR